MAKYGGESKSAAAVVVAGNLIAFGVCLPMALPLRYVGPTDLSVVLYLGIVQIGLAYMALTRSVKHVPAVEAATLLLLEPVLNPVWTWIIQGERLKCGDFGRWRFDCMRNIRINAIPGAVAQRCYR